MSLPLAPAVPLRDLLKQVMVPMLVTDRNGYTLTLNSQFQALCGHSAGEIRGRKPGDVLQGRDTDAETVRQLSTALRERKPFHGELLNYHKRGHTYWAHLSIFPVRGWFGRVTRFVAFAMDTTRHTTAAPGNGKGGTNRWLSVCMYCNAANLGTDGAEDWAPMAEVLATRFAIGLTHGICPKCVSHWDDDT